jgi:pimeloyl-ACP methyl ester carboxylesterase
MAQRFLLLHGTPLSPQVWDGVRAHLTADAVAPDLTELTESAAMSRLREERKPGSGCLQTEVAAAVLGALPDDEMVVVGHSFGGQVAIEVALLAPERLARLVVVCSRHTPFPAFANGARAVRACRPVDVDARLRRSFTPRELAAEGPAVRYARRQLQTAPRGPWAASLDAVATYDRASAVGRIAAPASLLAAGLDEVSPPAVMAELAAALPQATLEVVSAWAHMSPFADPAAFAARLLAAAIEPDRAGQLPSTP